MLENMTLTIEFHSRVSVRPIRYELLGVEYVAPPSTVRQLEALLESRFLDYVQNGYMFYLPVDDDTLQTLQHVTVICRRPGQHKRDFTIFTSAAKKRKIC